MNQYIMNSPVGFLKIRDNGNAITEISFVNESSTSQSKNEHASDLAKEAEKQLTEYFEKKRKNFALPLEPAGTDFQLEVWNALLTIPFGEIRCYQDIAVAVGRPKGSQAVGQANHRNPIAMVIPCHRVIGKNKKIVGYGGGIDHLKYLLALEGIVL